MAGKKKTGAGTANGSHAEASTAEAPRADVSTADVSTADVSAADSRRRVRVRMYRQGLGDCFLLSFPKEDGGTFHLMIDFGVLLGTSEAETRMKTVARSIADATGGRIDVLVATHEHWDHVSGFVQAREVFDRIRVGEVWLAWTEDPANPLANQLRQDRKRKVAHLHAAATRLAGDPRFGAAAEALDSVLGFFGDLAAASGGSTRDAIEGLAKRADARVVFRRPGEPPVRLAGVEGIRVYVLGPPEDSKLIKKSDPTKRGREVYEHHGSLSLADTFFAALPMSDAETAALDDDARMDPDAAELAFPFDGQYRIPQDAVGASPHAPFFASHYAEGDAGGWRRIDSDWLGVAADLALALDGDTNNTSLALAFELGEGGPVLLFPADAQVGNWLSWEALSWPDAGVTTDDLLRRTVLYKVGHHGSHNATLREKGLEKMTSPDLVALIPVEKEMAKKKKWAMPFGPLYERLLAKTRGRVVRVDEGRLPFEEAEKHGLTRTEWNDFADRTPEAGDRFPDQTPLWIEYHLDL